MTENSSKPLLTEIQTKEVKHFLKTGETDLLSWNWPGGPLLGGQKANAAMNDALIEEIRKRTVGLREATIPLEDAELFIKEKVSPMIEGFFPATERAVILARIEKSVFLSHN